MSPLIVPLRLVVNRWPACIIQSDGLADSARYWVSLTKDWNCSGLKVF